MFLLLGCSCQILHGNTQYWKRHSWWTQIIELQGSKKCQTGITWQLIGTFRSEDEDDYEYHFLFWARALRKMLASKPYVHAQYGKLVLVVILVLRSTVLYRSKVSWHSKLEPQDSILKPRCSKRSMIEYRVSRIEKQGFSNMQKLEWVLRKRFISRRENNTVRLTPIKIQVFRVDRYHVKTFDHTIAD